MLYPNEQTNQTQQVNNRLGSLNKPKQCAICSKVVPDIVEHLEQKCKKSWT